MALGDITYEWFSFPKKDSFTQFWCIGAVVPIMGPVVMIFCQDPLVKPEVLDAFIETLKEDHGVMFTDTIKKVNWPADYKPGAMGEFAFNRRHFDLTAKSRGRHRHRHTYMQVRAFAPEEPVRFDA